MNTNKWMFKSVSLFIVLMVSLTFVQAQTYKRKSKTDTSFRAPIIRNIDKVELMSIESRMGDIEKVDATKSIEGADAQNILGVWRKQQLIGYSAAACHQPPYALKFYSKGKMVLFATVCWECHNIAFIIPDVKHWVEFQSDSQTAKALKKIFERAFPSEKKFG